VTEVTTDRIAGPLGPGVPPDRPQRPAASPEVPADVFSASDAGAAQAIVAPQAPPDVQATENIPSPSADHLAALAEAVASGQYSVDAHQLGTIIADAFSGKRW
jgi:hypothetical protein